MDWEAHWRHAARKQGRGFQPELAMEFRAYVGDTLDQWRTDWESLPNAEVAKWLVAAKILTFTGTRFDQDRVRDFKRSLAKNDPRASAAIRRRAAEAAATVDDAREKLLRILTELDAPVTAERAQEIAETLDDLSVVFLEDLLDSTQPGIVSAIDLAQRKLLKATGVIWNRRS